MEKAGSPVLFHPTRFAAGALPAIRASPAGLRAKHSPVFPVPARTGRSRPSPACVPPADAANQKPAADKQSHRAPSPAARDALAGSHPACAPQPRSQTTVAAFPFAVAAQSAQRTVSPLSPGKLCPPSTTAAWPPANPGNAPLPPAKTLAETGGPHRRSCSLLATPSLSPLPAEYYHEAISFFLDHPLLPSPYPLHLPFTPPNSPPSTPAPAGTSARYSSPASTPPPWRAPQSTDRCSRSAALCAPAPPESFHKHPLRFPAIPSPEAPAPAPAKAPAPAPAARFSPPRTP